MMLIGYVREDNKSNRVMIVLRSFVLTLYGKVRQEYIYIWRYSRGKTKNENVLKSPKRVVSTANDNVS